jgi:hypothetical protein
MKNDDLTLLALLFNGTPTQAELHQAAEIARRLENNLTDENKTVE